jgi:hypothetical protein
MENAVCYCPICSGHVLGLESWPQKSSSDTAVGKLYCPHCEMLVEAATAPVDVIDPERPPVFTVAPQYAGRSGIDGSNAGGSQRGDLSDQGSTQWRTDPGTSERNSWRPKN